MALVDRFAPDADTDEAREGEWRPTVPSPDSATLAAATSLEQAGSGIRQVDAETRAQETEIVRFGCLRRVPRLAISVDTLREMKLDATTGFLLSHVDGETAFEELLDVCGMPHVQALRILGALRFLGIIEYEETGGRRPTR